MKMNTSMKALMQKYVVGPMEDIPQNNAYPIWEKADEAGRAYWGVPSFWGLDAHPIHSNRDLSQLEWDGNEVCLEAQTEEEFPNMLRNALGILAFWKNELETGYPLMPFYLFASYDNGDMLILDEGEAPITSVTLRFWADRGDNTVIDLSNFDKWEQPAIIEYCNFR